MFGLSNKHLGIKIDTKRDENLSEQSQKLLKDYKLGPDSKVLDVGCGKAFLLHEMKLLEPKLNIMGFDISKYALEKNTDVTKPHVYYHKAQDPFKYKDKEIDLAISLNVFHNLRIFIVPVRQAPENAGNENRRTRQHARN